jgi:hypothetical protein
MLAKYVMFVAMGLMPCAAFAQFHAYKRVAGTAPVCNTIKQFHNIMHSYNPGNLYKYRDKTNSLRKELGLQLITWKDSTIPFRLPDGLGGVQFEMFDFNNDGKKDYVFDDDGAGSYHFGSWLYVVLGGKKLDLSKSGVLSLSQVMAFPCQFDNISSITKCPSLSQANDEAGIEVKFENGANAWFRGRYTGLTPIRFRGQTFLFVDSVSVDGIEAVIRPYGVAKYSSVCLFTLR